MDHLEQFIEKSRTLILLSVFAENCMLLLVWWAASSYELQLNYVLISLLITALLGSIFLAYALAHALHGPLSTLWQLIIHLSPTRRKTSPPNTESVQFGHELVATLSAQVYHIANTASGTTSEKGGRSKTIPQGNFIADNLPLPLFVLAPDETIVFANEAACQYLTLDKDEIEGKNVYSVLDMSFSDEHTFDTWLADAKANTVTAAKTWERVRLKIADAAQPAQFDLAAYYNKDNPQKAETMLVMFDHTRQYSQDDQAMGFLAIAVHELRTPLTLLRGYIEVLEDELQGNVSEELEGFIHKMDASSQTLAAFVNNILNVARIDDDQLELRLQEEDWQKVLTAAIENLQLRARIRGMTIDCDIEPNLPTVGIDRVSMYEVIGNLVDNAIKYSGTSKRIVVRSQLSREGLVETTIQDSGVGIPQNVLPNIFTKFYRNHRNRSQIGGTGLGLYLSKALVSAHGGSIWVQSEEGKGTTIGFSILPYSELAEEQKNNHNSNIVRGAHGWIKNHSLYRR